ncbi:MAG: hypothetical protein AAFN74_20980, partial [Myxococcota bacterium]
MNRFILLALGLAVGCTARPAPDDTSAAARAVDGRDQYALASSVAEARRSVALPTDDLDDLDEAPAADEGPFARVQKAWNGRRYRWSLRWVPALCAGPSSCRVLPFDHRRAGAWGQGWLATLRLNDAA